MSQHEKLVEIRVMVPANTRHKLKELKEALGQPNLSSTLVQIIEAAYRAAIKSKGGG